MRWSGDIAPQTWGRETGPVPVESPSPTPARRSRSPPRGRELQSEGQGRVWARCVSRIAIGPWQYRVTGQDYWRARRRRGSPSDNGGEDGTMTTTLPAQIAFADQREALLDQQPGSERWIVDVQRQRRTARAEQERVGVVDVDLGGEQRGADGDQRLLLLLGEFDREEVRLAERKAGFPEHGAGGVRFGADQPDERGVGRFLDGEGNDAAAALLQRAEHHLEAADLVLEEDGELPDAGRFKTRAGFGLRRKHFFHASQHSGGLGGLIMKKCLRARG